MEIKTKVHTRKFTFPVVVEEVNENTPEISRVRVYKSQNSYIQIGIYNTSCDFVIDSISTLDKEIVNGNVRIVEEVVLRNTGIYGHG